jgi:hypothetical protein
MPEPAKLRKDSWISSNTGRGRAAGPALKLWILFAFIVINLHLGCVGGAVPRRFSHWYQSIDPIFLQIETDLSTRNINYIMIAVQQLFNLPLKAVKRDFRTEARIGAFLRFY